MPGVPMREDQDIDTQRKDQGHGEDVFTHLGGGNSPEGPWVTDLGSTFCGFSCLVCGWLQGLWDLLPWLWDTNTELYSQVYLLT